MTVEADILGKRLSFSGGSGGRNKGMMQQLSLPISVKYQDNVDIGTEWSVTTMNPVVAHQYANTYYDEATNCLYSITVGNENGANGLRLFIQDATSLAITSEFYAWNFVSSFQVKNCFIGQNGKMYVFTKSTTGNIYYWMWRINRESGTVTQLGKTDIYLQSFLARDCELLEPALPGTFSGFYVYYGSGGGNTFGLYQITFRVSDEYLSNALIIQNRPGTGDFGIRQFAGDSMYYLLFDNNSPVIYRSNGFFSSTVFRSSVPELSANGFPINNYSSCAPYNDIAIAFFHSVSSAGTKKLQMINLAANPIFVNKSIPALPTDLISEQANTRTLKNIGTKIIYQVNNSSAFLDLIPSPPQNKTPYLFLYKGDTVWLPFQKNPIDFLAIPNQEAFTLTNRPQVLTENKWVYDTQYTLNVGPTQLNILKK